MERTKIESRELEQLGVSENGINYYDNTDPISIYENHDGSYSVEGADARECDSVSDLVDFLNYNGDLLAAYEFVEKNADDWLYNPEALDDDQIKEWHDEEGHAVYPVEDQQRFDEDAVEWIHSEGKEVNDDSLWQYVKTCVPEWHEDAE